MRVLGYCVGVCRMPAVQKQDDVFFPPDISICRALYPRSRNVIVIARSSHAPLLRVFCGALFQVSDRYRVVVLKRLRVLRWCVLLILHRLRVLRCCVFLVLRRLRVLRWFVLRVLHRLRVCPRFRLFILSRLEEFPNSESSGL